MKQAKRVLVISVGKTPQPIIKRIRTYQPDEVYFFVSEDSKRMVCTEVIPEFPSLVHDFIFTPDHEDLNACYDALRKAKLKTDEGGILVDFTPGTKVMSVALGIWALNHGESMSYIGGSERDSATGRVLDDKEVVKVFTNPWMALAITELNRLVERFNGSDFYAAKKIAEDIVNSPLVSRNVRDFAENVGIVAGFLLDWDNTNYNSKLVGSAFRAGTELEKMGSYMNLQGLEEFGRKIKEAVDHYKKLNEHWKALNKGKKGSHEIRDLVKRDGPILVYDLVANAKRRAYHEGRYDDAIMRLYSAVEKMGKIALLVRGLDNSRLDPHVLMSHGIAVDKYKEKIGLVDTYRLLRELVDPLGEKYFSQEEEMKALMDERNSSYLIHGTKSSNEERFRKSLQKVVEFIRQDDETSWLEFPVIQNETLEGI